MADLGYNYTSSNRINDRGATGIAHGLSKSNRRLTMQDHTLTLPALKVCFKCGESKPLTNFYQTRTGRDAGRYCSYCKACQAENSRQRYAADPNSTERQRLKSRRLRAANLGKRYEYDPVRARASAKAQRAANPEAARAASARQKVLNRLRTRANVAVQYRVRRGYFPPAWTMVCECCQEAQAAHWHHHKGYEEEYRIDVIAMCTVCHGKEHRRL